MKRIIILSAYCLMTLVASAQLFSQETCRSAGSRHFAMEFLNNYFVDVLTQRDVSITRRMQDDKVYFRRGGINDLHQLSDTIPYTITLHEETPAHYEVTWSHHAGEDPFVDLVFPAQYELLLGMNQEQAQRQLQATVCSAPPITSLPSHGVLKPFTPSGKKKRGEHLFVCQSDTLFTSALSDATYYNREEHPVFDELHPDLSAANLFAGLASNADYELQMEQSVYGLKTVTYTLRLNQWLNYCAEWGLKTYFGIERQNNDTLQALVVVHSSELGFNHQLSVTLPPGFVGDNNMSLPVRLTAYIPTHNLMNLFKQESPKRKRIKWQ